MGTADVGVCHLWLPSAVLQAHYFATICRMLFFSAALLLLCFRHENLQIRIPAALVSAFVACPVTWCIQNSYRSRGEEDDINCAT
jgi:hypothetical protein